MVLLRGTAVRGEPQTCNVPERDATARRTLTRSPSEASE